jgi:hypothetical protein
MPIYMSITRETRVDVLTAVSFLLTCLLQFLEAAKDSDSGALDRVMASYGKHLLKISVLQSCVSKICYFPCHGMEALCISEYLILCYAGEEVVAAVGSEIDRLEKEIQRIVPATIQMAQSPERSSTCTDTSIPSSPLFYFVVLALSAQSEL